MLLANSIPLGSRNMPGLLSFSSWGSLCCQHETVGSGCSPGPSCPEVTQSETWVPILPSVSEVLRDGPLEWLIVIPLTRAFLAPGTLLLGLLYAYPHWNLMRIEDLRVFPHDNVAGMERSGFTFLRFGSLGLQFKHDCTAG